MILTLVSALVAGCIPHKSLSYLLNHRVLETGISFVAQHIPAHDDSFIRTIHMICRLNDRQTFHTLQIYLALSTGTIPWAATVNSACQASQGGCFFLQKEGDDDHFFGCWVDSTAVSIFVVILVELTNTVFVNSTNITTNIETAVLSICFPLLSCSSTSEHFTDFSLLAHESVALEEYSDGKLSRRGPL